jgi:hypothetical protein
MMAAVVTPANHFVRRKVAEQDTDHERKLRFATAKKHSAPAPKKRATGTSGVEKVFQIQKRRNVYARPKSPSLSEQFSGKSKTAHLRFTDLLQNNLMSTVRASTLMPTRTCEQSKLSVLMPWRD